MPNGMDAIGLCELSSIAVAYEVEDAMLKASAVELLLARTVCSGKYIVMVGGDVAAVEASVEAGRAVSQGALIEDLVISGVDHRLFPAIAGAALLEEKDLDALGIVEAFSIAAILEGADAAVKAAAVKLFRVHVAMAIGGKGYLMLTGTVADVEAAVAAGAAEVARRGMLVSRVVIPRPHPRLFQELI